MKSESGRSLIEVIGVLAITGVMTIGALGAYKMIRTNQTRTIATEQIKQIVQDTKILLEMRGSYEGVSIEYLIKAEKQFSEYIKNDVQPPLVLPVI